jgi:hypothetical protein
MPKVSVLQWPERQMVYKRQKIYFYLSQILFFLNFKNVP